MQDKLKQSKIQNEIEQFKRGINLLQDKLKQSKKIQSLLQNEQKQIIKKHNSSPIKRIQNIFQNETEQIKWKINLFQGKLEQFKKRPSLFQNELDQIAKMQNLSQNELQMSHKNAKTISRWTRGNRKKRRIKIYENISKEGLFIALLKLEQGLAKLYNKVEENKKYPDQYDPEYEGV